jgi:hypothetical protein
MCCALIAIGRHGMELIRHDIKKKIQDMHGDMHWEITYILSWYSSTDVHGMGAFEHGAKACSTEVCVYTHGYMHWEPPGGPRPQYTIL